MLSDALSSISDKAGPGFTQNPSFGTILQANMIFDPQALEKFNASNALTSAAIHPLTDDQITETYTSLLQSAAKSYVSGKLGRANVPGR